MKQLTEPKCLGIKNTKRTSHVQISEMYVCITFLIDCTFSACDKLPHSRVQAKGMQKHTHIVPRSKDANGVTRQLTPVILTEEILREHFSQPLNEAAKQLGVCETSLKRLAVSQSVLFDHLTFLSWMSRDTGDTFSACRKIGITKWPYRKVKHRQFCLLGDTLTILPSSTAQEPAHHARSTAPIRVPPIPARTGRRRRGAFARL